MKNSNLIVLLKCFNDKEVKKFSEFVRSPFFNKNESVIKLFDYLRKCHPEFDETKVQKENVYKKIFPGTKYNDGFMRKNIFNLSQLAETFLTYNKIAGNKIEWGLDLLEELNRRNLPKLFAKHFSVLSKEAESDSDNNYGYYLKKFQLETSFSRYIDNIRYKVDLHDRKEQHNEHLKQRLSSFTNYFLLLSLNMYRVLKYQEYTDRFEANDMLLNNIIEFLLNQLNTEKAIEQPAYINNTILKVHLYEIMLMKNKAGSEELLRDIYYTKLKDMLKDETRSLSHDLRFSLYNILLQHCAFRILRGFKEYGKERWELDKIALSQGIYMSIAEKYFPPPAFASIVRDASEAKQFEWAEIFINDYKTGLETNNFETAINLSYALINFNKKEYETSLEYLNKIKPVKRWEFKFAVKELTLLVFYELSMFSQAYYLLDSYRHFLIGMTRNFSSDRINSRNNFIKYYMKLLKVKEVSKKAGLPEIKSDLENKELLIFNRDWLREKINELTPHL